MSERVSPGGDSPSPGRAFAVWGSSGHAKVVAETIRLLGGTVAVLFDNRVEATAALPGVPLLTGARSFDEWLASPKRGCVDHGAVAIGGARGADRLAIQDSMLRAGLRFEPLVHPRSSVSGSAQIGAGTQVLACAVVAAEARIGRACIVNHQANVDHDCVLGDGVHVAPGATLCGCIRVGDFAMIGAGATILPWLSIGAGTIVGAGAVVTRDLPAGVVVTGNPARVVRPTA
jgi:sugar O-acyltransferase (sialic acid O-acetyltransferase NeuD family)